MSLTTELLVFARRAGTERSTTKLLAEMARFMAGSFSVERVSVYMYEEPGGRLLPLVAEYATGETRPEMWAHFRSVGDLRGLPLTVRIEAGVDSILDRNPHMGFPAEIVERFEIGPYLAVPLRSEAGLLGVVLVEGDPEVLTSHRSEFVELCGFVGLAIQNAQALEREMRRAAEAEALLEVASVLSRSVELTPVLAAVARNGARVAGFERASIFLLDEEGRLVPTMSQFADGHADEDAWRRFRSHPSEFRAGHRVVESGAPLVVADTRTDPETIDPQWVEPFGLRSVLIVPLEAWGERMGVLVLDHRNPRTISQGQLRLASAVAAQGAVAIGLARLLRTREETVRQLEELDRMRMDFVATVSHELRTPLTTIMGFSQLLEEVVEAPEAVEFVSLIRRESAHLAGLIANLLELSRLEAGMLSVATDRVDVGEVVREAADLVRVVQPGCSIDLEVEEGLWVEGDGARLRQVVTNLVENACKYGQGQVWVEGRRVGDRVSIRVEDDGPGIPPEARRAVFERFRRLDENRVTGAGVGLYLVKALVEAHRGSILVADGCRLGGACLQVEFPAAL